MKTAAGASDFQDPINTDNSSLLYEHLLYHNVIGKRSHQLDAIREGFKLTGLLDFLSTKKYLTSGVFPRNKDFVYPVSFVIEKIRSNRDHEIVGFVKDYIQGLQNRKLIPFFYC